MKIAISTAKEIVTQLAETIGQNINIMDTEGIIIASSDPAREGQVHAGAQRLIAEGLPLLAVEDDVQYAGARNGVNLPIVFENELVGTIGITGRVSEVLQYGQIIKRMTEILLLDSRIRERTVIEQKARDRFYDEWILGSLEERDEAEFFRMAEALSVSVSEAVRIAVLSLSFAEPTDDDVYTQVSRYIRRLLRQRLSGNAFRTATRMVCIVDEEKIPLLADTFAEAEQELRERYGCRIHMGASNLPATLHLHENYERAAAALDIAVLRNELLVWYDEFELDFLMRDIPQETCRRYLNRLFGRADETVAEELAFIRIYLEENGSLISISERMFLHKSTVKYRIGKLTEQTGVDIRTCQGAYLFTLALKLWDRLAGVSGGRRADS